jgi:uncharacterized membrane protein HdeD (DUF308 family)
MHGDTTFVEKSLTTMSRGILLRGVLAVAFGLVLLAWPGPTVGVLLTLFGFYAVVDGVSALWAASKAPSGERWPLVVQGVASVGSGVVGVIWPGISALALLYVIGAWAVIKGITELGTAIRRPAFVEHPVLLGSAGVLAMLFGVTVFVHPGAGALAVVTLMAILALTVGTLSIVASVRLGRATNEVHEQLHA